MSPLRIKPTRDSRVSLFILLITVVFSFLTASPSQAQVNSCAEIFQKSLDLGVKGQRALIKEYYQSTVEYKQSPTDDMLKVIEAKYMGIARELLTAKKIEFTEVLVNGWTEFIITPSKKTKFNKFAILVHDTYNAEVRFSASDLVEKEAAAFVMYFEERQSERRQLNLYIAWAHIVRALKFRPLRDPLMLHEMRHLALYRDLVAGIPSPYHGSVYLDGDIPNDQMVTVDVYRKFMSFSEIKTFHTQLKESLTLLRRMVRTGRGGDQLNMLMDIRRRLDHFAAISHRIQVIAKIMRDNPNLPGRAVLNDGIVYYSVEYNAPNGSVVKVEIPLLSSQGIDDPQNRNYFDRQLEWANLTARVALDQALLARRIFSRLIARDTIETIDDMQAALGVSDLIIPEPR